MKTTYKKVPQDDSRYDSEYIVLLDGEKIGTVYKRGVGRWECTCISGYEGSHNTRAYVTDYMIDRYHQDVTRAAEAKVWTVDGLEYREAVTGPSLNFQIRAMARGVVKMIDGMWYPVLNGAIADWTGYQHNSGAAQHLM